MRPFTNERKLDVACRRLGHSVEAAYTNNLVIGSEQAYSQELEQFAAPSNFAPVERLDL
jgi:hypothetical protein